MTRIDQWIKRFGVTSDYAEAGYILPDGTMLDFSERNNGGGGIRSLDHRAISGGDSQKMIQLMKRHGMIRMSFHGHGGNAFFDIFKPPTRQQVRVITGVLRYRPECIIFDFNKHENDETELMHPTLSDVLDLLNRTFQMNYESMEVVISSLLEG